MLLCLSNCSTCFLILFSPRLNEAQREEAREANAALEVNYISFILFCYVQFDLSDQWYILRDLQYCAPRLMMGEVAGFGSHGVQQSRGTSASVLHAKQMKISALTDWRENWLHSWVLRLFQLVEFGACTKWHYNFNFIFAFSLTFSTQAKIPWLWLIIPI